MILLVQHSILCTLSISENKQLYCHLSTSCHIFQRRYVIASWHPDNPTFTQTAISISDPYPLQLPPGALLSICLSLTGDCTQRCTVERRAPLNVRTLMQTCTNQHIFVAFLTFHPPLVSTGWRQVKWQLMCIIMSLCCVLLQFVVCCCDITERDDEWTTYITCKHICRIFLLTFFYRMPNLRASSPPPSYDRQSSEHGGLWPGELFMKLLLLVLAGSFKPKCQNLLMLSRLSFLPDKSMLLLFNQSIYCTVKAFVTRGVNR